MIHSILNKYRDIDIKIINTLKEDKEDIKLFEDREELIKEIIQIDQKLEVKKCYDELELKKLDSLIKELLDENLRKTKIKIKQTKQNLIANRTYMSSNRLENLFNIKA